MDWTLISLRVVHVGSAMAWFGGAVIGAFFLAPTAQALGTAAQPFMEHLLKRRRMGVFFPIVATLTILAGAALYWRDSNGLDPAWMASPTGLAFTIGGLAAIVAYVGGFVLIGPSVAAQTADAGRARRIGWRADRSAARAPRAADRRMRLANRIDLPLILLAGLAMAVGRYL